MHLSQLNVKGFRGIDYLEIKNIKQINLIVGRNNSSKTSILESILLLLGAGNPELSVRINSFRGLIHDEEEDFQFIFNKLNYDNKLYIEGVFETQEKKRKLEITPKCRNDGHSVIRNINPSIDVNFFDNSIDNYSNNGKINELQYHLEVSDEDSTKKTYNSSVYFDNGLKINLANNYRESVKVAYVSSSANINVGVDKKLENIIVNKKQERLINSIKRIDSSIINIQLGTKSMIYFDTGIEKLLPINLFGDGTRRLLNVLLVIADAENGVVIVDEIDNGLHFSALKFLWSAILSTAEEYNVQLFATTHNYEALKYFKEVLEEDSFVDFQNKVMSYTIRKLPDSTLKAYMYEFPSFELSIEEEIEIR